jgi:hypothetical protein
MAARCGRRRRYRYKRGAGSHAAATGDRLAIERRARARFLPEAVQGLIRRRRLRQG